MKLLIVTPYFYPKNGGLENYAYRFCLALQKLYKWDVVVVTSNHVAKKDTVNYISGMKVYRLAPLFRLSNTPINPFWISSIRKIIKHEHPDLINAHTPVPFIADIAAIVSGKVPFFLTYHAYTLQKQGSPLFNFIITLYQKIENLLFQRADKIIIVSDAIKSTIPPRFAKKIVTIYNSLPRREIPRNKRSTKKGNSLVFIGNLDKTHAWKGLDHVLLAMRSTSPSTTLTIVGDGNAKAVYKRAAKQHGIANRTYFVGKKSGKAKNTILRNATAAVIYPKTSNDAFPTVALEYWAHSLPIIASDIMPLNKIFKHTKTAFFVEPNSPEQLALAIKSVLKNKTLQKTMSTIGHHEIQSKYTLENEIKKYFVLTREYIK